MIRMSRIEQISVVARGQYEKAAKTGTIRVLLWDPQERLRRALKWWGACWAGALATVPIPLMHFVLPPSLLIAGPILFFRIRRQESQILEGEVACPECGARAKVPSAKPVFPLETLCAACQGRITINLL